jgi:ribosomal protein L35
MPKMKTHKATAKRFKMIRKKKAGKTSTQIIKRANGQDHFNARENGNTKRNKRSDNTQDNAMQKTILRALPYNH